MTLELPKPETLTPETKAEYIAAVRDYYAAGISEQDGGSPRENANDAYATFMAADEAQWYMLVVKVDEGLDLPESTGQGYAMAKRHRNHKAKLEEDKIEAERDSKLQAIRTKVSERVAHIQSHPLIDDAETEQTIAEYVAWQERRRAYLGSTDICALICEGYPWGTEFSVWAEKTGRAEFKKASDQTDFGKVFEEGTARLYGMKRKVSIQKCAEEIMHPTIPFLGTNRDYFTEGNASIPRRLIEVKTVHRMSGAEWGEPGTDDVPLWISVQAQWEMWISHLNGDHFDWCDVVVLREVGNPPVYPIAFDPELGQWLQDEVQEWWETHIIADVAPEVSGLPQDVSAVNRMFRREADAIIQATPRIDAIVEELACLCLQEKQNSERINKLENEIKIFMGDRTKLLSARGDIPFRQRKGRIAYKDLINAIGPLPTEFVETFRGEGKRNLTLPRGWKKGDYENE